MGDEAPILAVWHGETERAHPGSTPNHDRRPDKVRSRGSEDTAAGAAASGGEKASSSTHVDNEKGNQIRHRDVYALKPLPLDEAPSMLARVRAYRNTFAEILVIGSILQKLEGEELRAFERFRLEEAQRDLAKHKQEEEAQAAGAAVPPGKRNSLRLPSRRATVTAPPADRSRAVESDEPVEDGMAQAQEDVEALEDVADERWDGITSRLVKKEGRRLKHLLTGGTGSKTFRRAKTMA